MLRSVESEAEQPLSEGKHISGVNEAIARPVAKKVGRPSNAEKVATVTAQLAAGNLTRAQVDAMLPPKHAKVVRELAKASQEEFAVLLRGKYEVLAEDVVRKAGEEVENLKGMSAFVALGIIHDKLMATGPSQGITHQTNIQINGMGADAASAIASRFATKGVSKERINASGSDDAKCEKVVRSLTNADTLPISVTPRPTFRPCSDAVPILAVAS